MGKRVAIIYHSYHHGNTKKILEAIKNKFDFELYTVEEATNKDFKEYDIVGFASGIEAGQIYRKLLNFIKSYDYNSKNQKSFLITTSGFRSDIFSRSAIKAIKDKEFQLLGEYKCLGWNTFGPFKLVGGVAKLHPTEDEINSAIKFINDIINSN